MHLSGNRRRTPQAAKASLTTPLCIFSRTLLDQTGHTMTALRDTQAVADFMRTFGQTVRTAPTADITDAERLLRTRLVIEEALEFAEAMGCTVSVPPAAAATGETQIRAKHVAVEIDESASIDLVEAADAIGDLIVVTKGSAHTLGVPVDDVFDVVHVTNMAKAPGGVVRKQADGKVIKPEGWIPPTEAIKELLS